MEIEDEFDDNVQVKIDQFGWTIMGIGASDYLPSFAYTVGLTKGFGQPEIIVFGLSIKTLKILLNDAAARVMSSQKLVTDKTYDDFFEEGSVQFLTVDPRNIPDYFGYAIDYNGNDQFPAMQLVWTDSENRFPWDPDFDSKMEHRQPLLDRNAEFKFREPRQLPIYTSRQVLELGKPVLQVVHDHEGDWQFLSGKETETDVRVITLAEMVKKDPSVNDLFDLEYGEEAARAKIGGIWTREEFDEEELE